MKFYWVTISCTASFVYIFTHTLFHTFYMPRTWEKNCYSKSKLARFMNRTFKLVYNPVDYFFESALIAQFCIMIISIIVLIIDFSLSYAISNYLGDIILHILWVTALGMPHLYLIFLVVLWNSVVDWNYENE